MSDDVKKFFQMAGVDLENDRVKAVIENEDADQISGRLQPEELEKVYDQVRRTTLTKEEILDLAQAMVERGDYIRSPASAVFALNRMHILLHGIAPDGETQSRADTMFAIPDTMVQFVLGKGEFDREDLNVNVERAKEELKSRPVKRKKDVAVKLMSDFYMQNKSSLPKEIAKYRDQIVQDLMNGMSPEDAFGKYI